MSRIYFHSKDRDVEVHGSERAYFGGLCGSMLLVPLEGFFYEWRDRPSLVRHILPKDDYVQSYTDDMFEHMTRRRLQYGMDVNFTIDGQEIPIWTAALNTALVIGKGSVKLAARLHGQCEIHAYVEDENRGWLAGIIQQGLKTGIYRQGQGWMDVLNLLAEVDGPYVTSYSVCEGFPRPGVIESWGADEESRAKFYALSSDWQWNYAMAALRMNEMLELKPDNWDDYYFQDGWDGFKIASYLTKLEDERTDR